MRLGALTGRGEDIPVTGFAIDHRKVAPGTVFGAFKGQRFDGEDFIPAAVAAGAVAVVARPQAKVEGAVHIAADEPRREFARLAAKFFAPFPGTVVAVTGTNGKTSVAWFTIWICTASSGFPVESVTTPAMIRASPTPLVARTVASAYAGATTVTPCSWQP